MSVSNRMICRCNEVRAIIGLFSANERGILWRIFVKGMIIPPAEQGIVSSVRFRDSHLDVYIVSIEIRREYFPSS